MKVSERAHVILPYHRLLDRLREEHGAQERAEAEKSALRYVASARLMKIKSRVAGFKLSTCFVPSSCKTKLHRAIEEKNILLKHMFGAEQIEFQPLYEECLKIGERLKPYVSDVRAILVDALKKNRPILFEGAQGTLLDVDHGTYPYVTSSNTVSGGAMTGAGVGPAAVSQVIGITKAYTTRVGTGPFPSELEHTDQKKPRSASAKSAQSSERRRDVHDARDGSIWSR